MVNAKSVFVFLVVVQFLSLGSQAAPAKKKEKEPAATVVTRKIKGSSPAQIKKYKSDIGKSMQGELEKAMSALSTSKEVPVDVQKNAKLALKGIKSGKMKIALEEGAADILRRAPMQPGKPAEQLQTIIGVAGPGTPPDLRNPLQMALKFLTSNLGGVNNLLGRVASPDIMAGPVKGLAGALGATQDSLNGSIGGLGQLLGGLLHGIK